MLGNFSFGDYFKAEAIDYAWTLITREFGLAKDRLYVTVFREDDEAEALWQRVAGVSKARIFRLDEKDNFWQMGDTGPCGPCSEIHYDLGPESDPERSFPYDTGERYVEIWNLVFMQFERSADGAMTPLPRPSIDTGMGLERVTAVMQGKLSNYETDLLRPVVERAAELLGAAYGDDPKTDVALRINADHSRAAAFLIHDGVVPSNEGRGYVLRKIMRRAIRNGRMIGHPEPYLFQLTGFVAEIMKPAYPEMMESVQRVSRVVKDEEHRYATTFQVAEKVFLDEARSAAGGVIPGATAFKLYDTYGLALDEQQEMARERGLSIDTDGFDSEMDKQRVRARASWKGADKTQIADVYRFLPSTEFIGRDVLEARVTVLRVVEHDGKTELVLDRTPFYAEAGGQVGDSGILLRGDETAAIVEDTYKPAPGAVVHKVHLLSGVREGETLTARVDANLHASTMRNHTATHLLHAALRTVLGSHVKQAGSVVEPDRLRFDFTHYTAMDREELTEVERLMNQQILDNHELHTNVMDLDQALTTGAMALFGEKYGDKVRVVSIPGFSKELCGGTHVSRTGDIGLCKIIYEGSISAGVRRIEAVTGEKALQIFQQTVNSLHEVSDLVHSADVLASVEKLVDDKKALEKRIDQMKEKLANAQVSGLESQARDLKGIRVLAAEVTAMDRQQMRTVVDSLRNKGIGVVALASSDDGNINIVTAVSKELTAKIHAGKLAGAIAQKIGGKGGGRPDMAEGGGKNQEALGSALSDVYSSVEGTL
jgi:alanyl-tRNA synthetase